MSENQQPLQVGDTVVLKSGSPTLTITSLESSVEGAPEGHVDLICWQEGWKKPTILGNISPSCLVKASA